MPIKYAVGAAMAAVLLYGCAHDIQRDPALQKVAKPAAKGAGCPEVPYTVTATNAMASVRAGLIESLAKDIARFPTLTAKLEFAHERLMSSASQASKEVLKAYFCRARAAYPDKRKEIGTVDVALNDAIERTFSVENFKDAGTVAALETDLRDTIGPGFDAVATLPVADWDTLMEMFKTSGFSEVKSFSGQINVEIAKYKLDLCTAALAASTASGLTAALANHLDALAGIVSDTLTGNRPGVINAKLLRDGARATNNAADVGALKKYLNDDNSFKACINEQK